MSEATTAALNECRQTVRRGVAFLDANLPGWRNRINLGRFEMNEPESCILGQAHASRDYWLAVNALGMSQTEAAAHGFTVHDYGTYDDDDDDNAMDLLQAAWLEALAI